MLFDKFVDEVTKKWTAYLRQLYTYQCDEKFYVVDGHVLYPNIILFTNCGDFYVAELIGASKKFSNFVIKKHKEKSIHRYFSQFYDDAPNPQIIFENGCTGIRNLNLMGRMETELIRERFPHTNLIGVELVRDSLLGSALGFHGNFTSTVINNCNLINSTGPLFRCKNILSAFVAHKAIEKSEIKEVFDGFLKFEVPIGIHLVKESDDRLVIAAQLQNIFLFPGLRETTIGEFINCHPEIIKKTFNSTHFEYEPTLKWLQHDGTCTDSSINPDLMVRRADGYYDIYDLKTALLDKKSITKADRNRRRFIDAVCEGVAQLANYREYFQYEKNAEYAKEKYGIAVNCPRLVLVVGNYENVDVDEVKQACRQYNDVQIIDYDTVCQIFIHAT